MKINVLLVPALFAALNTTFAHYWRIFFHFGSEKKSTNKPIRVTLACVFFTCLYIVTSKTLVAQPTKEWDKTIGGTSFENFYSLHQTSDGGYILGGLSNSDISGDKTQDNKGGGDYWIVKLNAAGTNEWDKTIGGNNIDQLHYVHQTTDGGYILGGASDSPASGDKSESNKGGIDFWVVKLDPAGNIEWDKTIGGLENDFFYAMQQTADKGFIISGFSHSDAGGDKTENNKGEGDYWVVKLDLGGNVEWDRTLGGSNSDQFTALHQTNDGGYILGGTSISNKSGDKSENNKGGGDFWVIKLDAAGVKEWDKTIGGNQEDVLQSVMQTTDGSYILGGTSNSNIGDDKSENSKGFQDYWVVKLDGSGNKLWDRTYGGFESDIFTALQLTTDNGYILGGFSRSGVNGDKTEPFIGGADYWIVKLNAAGAKEWDKTIGGPAFETLDALQQTADGGYILGGSSISNAGADKTEDSKGGDDYWVVKLSSETTPSGNCNIALTTKITQAEPWYGMWGPFNGAGAIDLTVIGGIGPYTYRWNSGTATQDIPAASPGMYSVTVTDAKGCIATTTVHVGRKNSPLTLASSHLNISGVGLQDGSIDLSVIGGVVPATFRWSNGATTEDLTNLAAGTYTVVVTDAFGRTATTTVTISAPGTALSLMEEHKDVSKAGADDGFIDLTVVGGQRPYTYRWNNGPTTQDLPRVTAGLYSVWVTDASGASATLSVRINAPGTTSSAKSPALTETFIEENNFRVYPNPATDKVSVNFSLGASGNYTLELYDPRGAKVKTIAAGQAPKDQILHINLSGYAEGIYLLKLQTDRGIATKRISILR